MELVENIIIVKFFLVKLWVFRLVVIDSHNQIPEVFVHVKLLHHGVDVADVAKIF